MGDSLSAAAELEEDERRWQLRVLKDPSLSAVCLLLAHLEHVLENYAFVKRDYELLRKNLDQYNSFLGRGYHKYKIPLEIRRQLASMLEVTEK